MSRAVTARGAVLRSAERVGTEPQSFEVAFGEVASSVRRRLAQRAGLTGLTVGLWAAVPSAAAAWLARLEPRAIAPLAVGAAACVLGALMARARRSLSDVQLALYLDRRLRSDELITSALGASPASTAAPTLRARASALLAAAPRAVALPSSWARHHLAAPLALAALVALSLLPARPAPPDPAPPPGAEPITLQDVPDLDRAIRELEGLHASDPEQEARLRAIEERARGLRERLRSGLERREVQAELSELTDSIGAEGLGLARDERRGLEAALEELTAPELKGLERALSRGDARALDQETQRLARQADADARAGAREALEAAAGAARDEGASQVARALEEQQRRFDEAERGAARARQLASALESSLPEEAARDREAADQRGDDAAARRLASALAEALEKLSPEQREALAKKLSQQAKSGQGARGEPLSEEQREALEELAEGLASEQGMEELVEQLEAMADANAASEAAALDAGLSRAGAALDALKESIAKGAGDAPPAPGPAPAGSGLPSPGAAGPGGDSPGGGATPKLPGSGAPALAASGAPVRVPGGPRPGAPGELKRVRRAPSQPGEVANVRGAGALGEVAESEINGVSRGEVPEEYRDQVGRYFRP